MPKKKKHPRLPNAFGSIRILGSGRKNPYAVHPPCTEFTDNGYKRPKALCYVNDWYVGFSVLMAYHAGTYHPGDELEFARQREKSTMSMSNLDVFCERILSDFLIHSKAEATLREQEKTFKEVYAEFYEWKFGENAEKKLSDSSKHAANAAFKNCSLIHDSVFSRLTVDELQRAVNQGKERGLKEASLETMVSLIRQLYKFAEVRDYCPKDIGKAVIVPDAPKDEHGVPFTEKDLALFWDHQEDETVEMLLIMCYSGMRISEYKATKIDFSNWSFCGGLKTEAGKNRIVPIHPFIRPLVQRRVQRDGKLLKMQNDQFRAQMQKTLNNLGIEKHTPHDCRHTFSMLCEKYEVKENDRKRMLGHKFANDVTNRVYGHRTLDDLQKEIVKIRKPFQN